ncbi:hypothetical protein BGZ95_004937 [Linnemannia exigua]|uniref:Uncharacterized protein n=1 Tax=Linnemannia exigua TaxID=604196 RepID=A0AAD4D2F8_9FUNG|nr:hypothetical protein BGZ95_004937 [Linnemannia exigua]
MSSQQSPRTPGRTGKNLRFASETQVHQMVAETPSPPPSSSASTSQHPVPASQHPFLSDNWSEQDDNTGEADVTIDHSQRSDSPSYEVPQPSQAPLPAPTRSLVSEQPASAVVQEAWWMSLQQEQLVAYTQQQQELFSQLGKATTRLLNCTSAQEHEQLLLTAQLLAQREHELRYMLEARQAWEAFVRMSEQRLTHLSARAQPHP